MLMLFIVFGAMVIRKVIRESPEAQTHLLIRAYLLREALTELDLVSTPAGARLRPAQSFLVWSA